MVRKTSHDLVLTEESWVPCDLITESNMPRRAVIAIIVKITSAKATNSVPNISGTHPCSLSSPFCYCNSYCCNANCSYQVQPSASQNKNRCNHRNNYEEKCVSLHFFIHHWFSPSRLYAAVEIHPSFCRLCPYSRNRLKFLAWQRFSLAVFSFLFTF